MKNSRKPRNSADPYPQRGQQGRNTQLKNLPTSQPVTTPSPDLTSNLMASTPIPNSQTGGAQFKVDASSAQAFCVALKQFFNNERLADATICCGDQEFKVHAILFSVHSNFFYKAFCGQLKSKNSKIIKLEEVEVEVVKAMIQFMYHFDYSSPDGVSTSLFDAKVYSIADRYLIPKLKDYSKTKFETAVSRIPLTANFLACLCAVSSEVYCSTPEPDRGLRDIVVEAFHTRLSILEESDVFHTSLREIPALAIDMIFFKPKPRGW
ncbi:BTB/POZ protein [Xylaria castorea]|nr:BTB/POZ protein [Xylaria castorea]